jgi:hypothetical protein
LLSVWGAARKLSGSSGVGAQSRPEGAWSCRVSQSIWQLEHWSLVHSLIIDSPVTDMKKPAGE